MFKKNTPSPAEVREEETPVSERERFEKEREEYMKEKNEFSARRMLESENLPEELAPIVCGADDKETEDNIGVIRAVIAKAVAAAVKDKIKGSVPKIGGGEEKDDFLSGFGI